MYSVAGGCGSAQTGQARRNRRSGFGWVVGLPLLIVLFGWPVLVGAEEPAKVSPAAPSAVSDPMDQIPTGKEAVDQVMKVLSERLALSDEQKSEIRPSVAEMVASMTKLRDRYKAGEIKPMALAMQMQMLEKKSSVLIGPILTDEQRAQYETLRQEQRRRMMEEMKKRNRP